MLRELTESHQQLSEICSQTPQSEHMTSSVLSRTRQVKELSGIYETCRGHVSHRAQDLQLLHDRIEDGRKRLSELTATLDTTQLALDLDTKTLHLDELKVRLVCVHDSCECLTVSQTSLLSQNPVSSTTLGGTPSVISFTQE